MGLPIAKEGWPIIGTGFGLALFSVLLWHVSFHWFFALLSLLFCVFMLFSLYFFRDPERSIPEGEGLILSPADGRVVAIEDVDEPDFLQGSSKRVSIFMSPLNVHVNRAPISGEVVFEKYNPGKFVMAWRDKASELNEQNSIGIVADERKYLVRQIAGWVARRIVCAVKPTQKVRAGERYGMIRFGSRVDLFLPPQAVEVKVEVGQKVYGGTSVIGVLQ